MKKQQRFTPKYWIAHDKNSDDVLFSTAAKSRAEALDRLKRIHRVQYDDYLTNEYSSIELAVFEVQLCQS